MLARRALLAGLGAAAACGCCAATRPKLPAGLIDVHHHIRPPGAPEGFARLTASWSPERAVADMDRAGVRVGMAYPGPILSGDAAARRATARRSNEFAAGLAVAHPGRFGLFASLPFPDIDGTLAEIDFALTNLRADGFGLATSYGDRWLGDAHFAPVWERLNAANAVMFVHPHDAACCPPASLTYLQPGMDGSWIDWPMNTARTIFSLITSGTLRRYPRIRFIFAHGGGVMPLLIERLADFTHWSAVGPQRMIELFPNGIEAEFAGLYFEGAQAWSRPNLAALRSLVPDTHILFGSDYPFFALDHAVRGLGGAGLAPRSVRGIGYDNAAALLPRWAKV